MLLELKIRRCYPPFFKGYFLLLLFLTQNSLLYIVNSWKYEFFIKDEWSNALFPFTIQ
jgi:hypothetical protein